MLDLVVSSACRALGAESNIALAPKLEPLLNKTENLSQKSEILFIFGVDSDWL